MLLLAHLATNQPFYSRALNCAESLGEVVIIVACYHLLLLTDFVPLSNNEFRSAVVYSLIGWLVLTFGLFVIQIIVSVATSVGKIFCTKIRQR